jgi:hypothetical protein
MPSMTTMMSSHHLLPPPPHFVNKSVCALLVYSYFGCAVKMHRHIGLIRAHGSKGGQDFPKCLCLNVCKICLKREFNEICVVTTYRTDINKK